MRPLMPKSKGHQWSPKWAPDGKMLGPVSRGGLAALTALNNAFHAAYADAKSRVLASSGPTLIVNGDNFALLRDGRRVEAPAICHLARNEHSPQCLRLRDEENVTGFAKVQLGSAFFLNSLQFRQHFKVTRATRRAFRPDQLRQTQAPAPHPKD
jgi:hypothetical protein